MTALGVGHTSALGWVLLKVPRILLAPEPASRLCEQVGSFQEGVDKKLESFSCAWNSCLTFFFRWLSGKFLIFVPYFHSFSGVFKGWRDKAWSRMSDVVRGWNGDYLWGRRETTQCLDTAAPTLLPSAGSGRPVPSWTWLCCPPTLPFSRFYWGTWLKVGE